MIRMHCRKRTWRSEFQVKLCSSARHSPLAKLMYVRPMARPDRLSAGFMTAGEGEFLGLSKGEAEMRIADGGALIGDVIGRPIAGFVAPAWLYGRAALDALAACAIPIAEDHLRVRSPKTGET